MKKQKVLYICPECYRLKDHEGRWRKVSLQTKAEMVKKAKEVENVLCEECEERNKRLRRLEVARDSCSCSLEWKEMGSSL